MKYIRQIDIQFLSTYSPCLPGRYGEQFVEKRREKLERWSNRIARHPVLSRSEVVSHFFLCDGEGVSGRRRRGGVEGCRELGWEEEGQGRGRNGGRGGGSGKKGGGGRGDGMERRNGGRGEGTRGEEERRE